jgi:hypothetical protein
MNRLLVLAVLGLTQSLVAGDEEEA